ncbi:hypothetical protein LCGC14_0567370 [marine sediment metagenome]|uniref:Portal protein n=1 Tax=marine sediment metagenome TaxID=412755 RepID=A0A0F9RK63_9ZZZZ
MTRTIQEIQELYEWESVTHHSKRISEQTMDWSYYKDDFPVPFIKSPYKATRLGVGVEIVDVPVSHIVTSEPQVYVEATADNTTARERALKRGTFLNHLVDFLTFQSPQPFKETVKNQLVSGEAWIHLVNNDQFKDDIFPDDIPITFSIPDPKIIYASADERNGIPDYFFISYKRYFQSVINKYEHWPNPLGRGGKDKYVDWLVYFDKGIRYFQADGVPVLEGGIQLNILGFTPIVHCYSGYGKSSPDGNPEELAVSRIRPVRGKILAYTELASSIASQLKLYAHKRYDFQPTDKEIKFTQDDVKNYDLNYGSANVVPWGVNIIERGGSPPLAEVFNFMSMLRYEITRATPPLMMGMGSGSSGRAEDIETKHSLSQYASVVDNASTAWAMALSLTLRMMKNKDLGLLPLTLRATVPAEGVRKAIILEDSDIDDLRCTLKLKAADPIEDKAQAQIGTSKWQIGEIDHETNLIEFQGKSLDEAQRIIVKTRAEKFMNSPEFATTIGMAALEKLGIEPPPAEGAPPTGPVPGQRGARGGPPRTGNRKSIDALAKDADMQLANRPPRMSPGLG